MSHSSTVTFFNYISIISFSSFFTGLAHKIRLAKFVLCELLPESNLEKTRNLTYVSIKSP